MMMSGSRMVPWLGILLLLVLEVKSFVPTTRFAVSRPSIGLSRQHQWSKPSPPTYVLSSVSDTDETEELADSNESSDSTERLGPLARLRKYYAKSDDGLTFRQRLGKMGLNVALSYGWVSNMSYAVTVSLAWYIFSKRTGLSPLAPGQWKRFLVTYAGFYVFNNLVRPIRLAAAVGVGPTFDRLVQRISKNLNVSKGVAIGITVFMVNVVGTTVAMSTGIFVASLVSGVPVWTR